MQEYKYIWHSSAGWLLNICKNEDWIWNETLKW
jgi:hypothetical protein